MSDIPFRADRPSVVDRCAHSGYAKPFSSRDFRCCTVIAFAAAFQVLYSEADAVLKRAGRKFRRGFSTCRLVESKAVNPYGTVREAKWFYQEGAKSWAANMKVKTFLKQADPGKRYMVCVAGHVFAVVNGRLVDSVDQLNCHVKWIYEVTPHVDRPGAINFPALTR